MLRELIVAFSVIGTVWALRENIQFAPLDQELTAPADFWMPLRNDVPQDYCTNPRYPSVPTEGPIVMSILEELFPNGTVPKVPARPTNVWQKNLWGFNWTDHSDWGAIYPYPYVVQPRAGQVSLMYPGAPVNLTGNSAMQQGFAVPGVTPPNHPKILNASYPYMTMSTAFDLGVNIFNGMEMKLSELSPLGATIEMKDEVNNATVATLYLLKGSPFINFECSNAMIGFGQLDVPPVISINGLPPGTTLTEKHFEFHVAEGPVHQEAKYWHIFFSEPVTLTLPTNPVYGINASAPFTGLMQIATGTFHNKEAPLLTKSAGTYARGAQIEYDIDDVKQTAVVRFAYEKVGKGELAMLALAHHVKLLPSDTVKIGTQFWSVKGNMTMIIADQWNLTYTLTSVGFGEELTVDQDMKKDLLQAALLDYSLRIGKCPGDNDTYNGTHGFPGYMNMELYAYARDLAQMTDIAIVLENLGQREHAVNMTKHVQRCMVWILKRPERAPYACPPPINGTVQCVRDMMDVYYDTKWGGLITGWFDRFAKNYCQCDKPGGPYACRGYNYCDNPRAWDGFANYGNAFYNDHHFQYGYVIKSLAWALYYQEQKKVPLGMNSTVVRNVTKQALAFARDIANPDATKDKFFAFIRHKDFYDGHSWAEGYDYSGRILTWVNQQSGGEAINAYYSVYLLGLALNDTNVRDWGRIQLATEATSIAQYQHLSNRSAGKKEQPTKIINDWGKCLSILIGNGASGATYYGPNPLFQCGITLIPITPFTREWVDSEWATEAADWIKWHNNRTGNCIFYDPFTMKENPCPGQMPANWTGNEWACCPTNVGYPDNQWRAYPQWFPYLMLLDSWKFPEKAWKDLQFSNVSMPTKSLPFPYLWNDHVVGFQHDLTRTSAYFHVATHKRKSP